MSDETINQTSKPKRVSSETTKDGWVIRCMAAENTVKAQDAELRQVREHLQAREKAAAAARELAGQNIRLRARESRLVGAASLLTVIVIVLAVFLIGGAR